MALQYWAKRGPHMMGPYASRTEAVDAFRAAYPVKGPAWEARARKNDILSGYGAFGPDFNMDWSKAIPD